MTTPIQQFIETAIAERALTARELLYRVGFRDMQKADQRLAALYEGELKKNRFILDALPSILGVERSAVLEAEAATVKYLRDLALKQYCDVFEPNASINTAMNGRPKQILIAALVQAGKYVNVVFPADMKPEEYLPRTIEFYHRQKKNIDQFFYEPESIIVRWHPGHSSIYTLSGEHLRDETEIRLPNTFGIRIK